jgi:hypothetical protein
MRRRVARDDRRSGCGMAITTRVCSGRHNRNALVVGALQQKLAIAEPSMAGVCVAMLARPARRVRRATDWAYTDLLPLVGANIWEMPASSKTAT